MGKALFSALIEDEELTEGEIEELKNLIDKRLGAKEDKKKDRK